jgi:RNA-directed DNA polymerase
VWRWVKREHCNKTKAWIKEKYYHKHPSRQWSFSSYKPTQKAASKRLFLICMADTPIVRYVKTRNNANPFLPEYRNYFRHRWLYMKKLNLHHLATAGHLEKVCLNQA